MDIQLVLWFMLTALIALAAWWDIRTRRIPNLLVLLLIASGLSMNLMLHGLGGLVTSFGGFFLGIGLLIIPYSLGGMGAGDVKLMGGVGAVLGPLGVFWAAVAASLVGGAHALLLLSREFIRNRVMRREIGMALACGGYFSLPACASAFSTALKVTKENNGGLCFAVSIAAGTLGYLAFETLRS